MRDIRPAERANLLPTMGIAEKAWEQRLKNPGMMRWDEVLALKAFLDRKYGADHDMAALKEALI